MACSSNVLNLSFFQCENHLYKHPLNTFCDEAKNGYLTNIGKRVIFG